MTHSYKKQHTKNRWAIEEIITLIIVGVFFVSIVLSDMRVRVLNIGDSAISPVTVASVGVALWAVYIHKKNNHQGSWGKKHRWWIILVSLYCMSFIAKAWSAQTVHAWGIALEWVVMPVMGAVATAYLWLVAHKQKMAMSIHAQMQWAVCGVMGVISMISVVMLFIGDRTYDDRFYGIWTSPNHLALLLAPLLAMSIIGLMWHRGSFVGLCAQISIIIGSVMILIATQSLGALLGLCGAVMMFAMVKCVNAMQVSRKGVVGTVVMMGMLGAILATAGVYKFESAYEQSDRSPLASRIMIWSAAADMIRHNPVTGIPLGEFQDQYLAYQKFYPPYLEWSAPLPHNTALALWLYGGVGTVVLFCTIIVQVIVLLLNMRNRQTTEAKKVQLIAIGGILTIVIHGVFDTHLMRSDLAAAFWLLCVVLVATSSDTIGSQEA